MFEKIKTFFYERQHRRGGNNREPFKADPLFLTSGIVCTDFRPWMLFSTAAKLLPLKKSGKLTELLYEVTVIDAFLRAEGGQLKSGRLLFFLLGDKKNNNACVKMLAIVT